MEVQLEETDIETIMTNKGNQIALTHKPTWKMQQKKNLPALAGIVHGVVVQMAKHKFGNSCSRSIRIKGALASLKMAYMLSETCPSGYYIETDKVVNRYSNIHQIRF